MADDNDTKRSIALDGFTVRSDSFGLIVKNPKKPQVTDRPPPPAPIMSQPGGSGTKGVPGTTSDKPKG